MSRLPGTNLTSGRLRCRLRIRGGNNVRSPFGVSRPRGRGYNNIYWRTMEKRDTVINHSDEVLRRSSTIQPLLRQLLRRTDRGTAIQPNCWAGAALPVPVAVPREESEFRGEIVGLTDHKLQHLWLYSRNRHYWTRRTRRSTGQRWMQYVDFEHIKAIAAYRPARDVARTDGQVMTSDGDLKPGIPA